MSNDNNKSGCGALIGGVLLAIAGGFKACGHDAGPIIEDLARVHPSIPASGAAVDDLSNTFAHGAAHANFNPDAAENTLGQTADGVNSTDHGSSTSDNLYEGYNPHGPTLDHPGAEPIVHDPVVADAGASGGNAHYDDEEVSYHPLKIRGYPPEMFRMPVARPGVISLLPETDDEFRAVYGRDASVSDLLQTVSLAKERLTLGRQWNLDPHTELIRELMHLNNDLVIFIGHSTEQGGKIYFPNGASISIDDLHSACAQAAKICLTLTCHSQDIGLSDEITGAEAFAIWRNTLQRITGRQVTAMELPDILRAERERLSNHVALQITWIGVSLTGGTTAVCYSDTRSRKRPLRVRWSSVFPPPAVNPATTLWPPAAPH